jgi:sterol desaturase/sphingolipid hydroxylase (fatty acid hydroxylase superfamily)
MNLYLEYWLTFFVVFPILEWGFHYALHRFNNKIHNNHHKIITNYRIDKIKKYRIELWPIIPIVLCLYNTFFIGALIFTKYYVVHSLIHIYPDILSKELKDHHNIHHIYSNYNFCVTNIWPDILFKTQYKKKDKNA